MKKFLFPLFLFCLLIGCAGNVAAQPTVPSANINFSSIDGTSMIADWTPGDGANRIVVARAGTPVSAVPCKWDRL